MRRKVRELIRKFGYDIIRYNPETIGKNPFDDMTKFIRTDNPMLFDVGANTGQTIKKFKQVFDKCTINSFEPSPTTFEVLKKNTSQMKNVHIWNLGIGSSTDPIILNENNHPDMSSILEIGDKGWGEIKNKTTIDLTTIDQFCENQNIKMIDVLKCDTQGFELEVFKGAATSMLENKIGLLYFEVVFINMYKGLPTISELFDFAVKHGFELVSIYPLKYKQNIAGWTDLLFKHKKYKS